MYFNRIIEIGSRFFTFRIHDTNEKWCNKEVEINYIEPYPDRLLNGLRENDALNINKICTRYSVDFF